MTLYMNDKDSIYDHLLSAAYRFKTTETGAEFLPEGKNTFADMMLVTSDLTDDFVREMDEYQRKEFVISFPFKETFTAQRNITHWWQLLRIITEKQFKFHNSVDRQPVAIADDDQPEVDPVRLKAMQHVDWQEINRLVKDALLNAKASYIGNYPAEFYADQAELFDTNMTTSIGVSFADLGKYKSWPDYIEKNNIRSWNMFTNIISHNLFDYQVSHQLTQEEQAAAPADETKTATVRATYLNGDVIFQTVENISSDMPADALGEIVAGVMQHAWEKGDDPVSATIVLTFGKV